MEKSNNPNPDIISKELSGADGIFLMDFKRYGEEWVPLGFFYDTVERIEALRLRISDSLMPLLFQLKDEILTHYTLDENSLRFSACIYGIWFTQISLETLQEIAENELYRLGAENFKIQLVIECFDCQHDGLIYWGTLINIIYGEETWTNDETEYPIWFLYIEDMENLIEEPISDVVIDFMIGVILKQLAMDLTHATKSKSVISWDAAQNIAHYIMSIPEKDLMVYPSKPIDFNVFGVSIDEPSWFVYSPMTINRQEASWFSSSPKDNVCIYTYAQECQVVVISMSTGRVLYHGPNNSPETV